MIERNVCAEVPPTERLFRDGEPVSLAGCVVHAVVHICHCLHHTFLDSEEITGANWGNLVLSHAQFDKSWGRMFGMWPAGQKFWNVQYHLLLYLMVLIQGWIHRGGSNWGRVQPQVGGAGGGNFYKNV